jgi:glutamate/tyrosine decarboxylase-like PLP-dependent enzyme
MHSRLAADLAAFPQILDNARDKAVAFLASLESRPAAAQVANYASAALPEEGTGGEAALDELWRRFEPQFAGSAGPRYLGFVTGGGTPASVAADALVSVIDQNTQRTGGTVAAFVEREALDWLRELFGLSAAHTGSFVSGATMANLVGLAIGRQWLGHRHGVDVAKQGLSGMPPIRVLSATAHSSTLKAMSMLGLGRDAHVAVATVPPQPGDVREAVELAALERALVAHEGQPVIVVGNAGTVNTVDFDDLRGIAALRERHPFWFHVDAAFGAFAASSPKFAALAEGLDLADSITVDAHKWLNVPYDSAMQYTRHLPLQLEVFQNVSAYLPPPEAAPENFTHLTPENSRRFRALAVWAALRAYGRAGHREIVERCCACASSLGARLAAHPDFELMAPVRMNVVCFATRPGLDSGALLQRVQQDGRAFLTPTVLGGRPAMRAAFSNWRTTEADVEIVFAALADAAKEVAAGRR